jgi:hypothetical protein
MYLLQVSPVPYVYFQYGRLTINGYSDWRTCKGNAFTLVESAPHIPFWPGSFECFDY